jgi:deoxyribodipyrimidine photo-lyase|tara:strand:- start:10524 stop:11804 length:1281 start_codon:yes stop_codon:yes gene_type:complete
MKKAIYWFRKNLRVQDNPSLSKAIEDNDELICIYIKDYSIFNPKGLELGSMGDYRKKFLNESIINLKSEIKKLDLNLYIFEGGIENIFNEIKKRTKCNIVYGSKEVGWYEEIEEKKLVTKDFKLNLFNDQNLIELNNLPYEIKDIPLVFTHFRKKVEKEFKIRDLVKIKKKVMKKNIYSFDYQSRIERSEIKFNNNSNYPFIGGEKHGIKRLNNYLWETNGLKKYKETRNELIGTEYSSKLSAFLSIGCLSPVMIYHEVKKYESKVIKNSSTYWLIFEILWREFFRYVYLKEKIKIFIKKGINGNIFNKNFKNDINKFEKWKKGKTGQDFIDANMKELLKTGFMSNRGRQNVASYLVNNLDINWIWGASHFEKHLVDYDVCSNWCNWMYISGVGNNIKNWIFNPQRQSEIYDKKEIYRQIWLKINM